MRSFGAFFEAWVGGYYEKAKLGKGGDFYTAVSSSRFFGGALANFILQKLEDSTLCLPLNIIDVGANSTTLLADIFDFLEALGLGVAERCEFFAIEKNAANPLNLAANLGAKSLNLAGAANPSGEKPANLANPTNPAANLGANPAAQNPKKFSPKILPNLESLGVLEQNCIFIANEFFDALPCELIYEGKIALESGFAIDFVGREKCESGESFGRRESGESLKNRESSQHKGANPSESCESSQCEGKNPRESPQDSPQGFAQIYEAAERFGIKKGEVALSYFDFCQSLQNINPRGEKWLFLAFDYGNPAPLNEFTLRIFQKHSVFSFFGESKEPKNDQDSKTPAPPKTIPPLQTTHAAPPKNATAPAAKNPAAPLPANANLTDKNTVAQPSRQANASAFLPIFAAKTPAPPTPRALEALFQNADITYNVPFFMLDAAFEKIGAKKILFKRLNCALIEDFLVLDLVQKFHDHGGANERIYLGEMNRLKTLLNVLGERFYAAIYVNS